MQEKSWNAIGLTAMGLILFVATMIIIRWVIGFVTWTTLDSGWAQAIGTVGAIIGTWAVARYQFLKERDVKRAERLEAEAAITQIGNDLAFATHRSLMDIRNKFELSWRHGVACRVIGLDRLDDLKIALHNFSSKDIPAPLYAQLLVLQREVAYTRTAVVEQNAAHGVVSVERVDKATGRMMAVFEAKMAIKGIFEKAQLAAGLDPDAVHLSTFPVD